VQRLVGGRRALDPHTVSRHLVLVAKLPKDLVAVEELRRLVPNVR
jgi:hypothetical protein